MERIEQNDFIQVNLIIFLCTSTQYLWKLLIFLIIWRYTFLSQKWEIRKHNIKLDLFWLQWLPNCSFASSQDKTALKEQYIHASWLECWVQDEIWCEWTFVYSETRCKAMYVEQWTFFPRCLSLQRKISFAVKSHNITQRTFFRVG